jgi:putative FmdB family regulatory protein
MKFYDFKCKKCGEIFESEEKIKCPNCESKDVYKLYKINGIIYKSSGFYDYDNRKKNENNS